MANYQQLIREEMKYQRERLYKRLKQADNGRLVVEYWAGAQDFLRSVPGIDWEKQGNKILIKENKQMKTFKELLTEKTRVGTDKYMASHGKKPKGTGAWAFIVDGETVFAPGTKKYADAVKWVQAEYPKANKIEAGP